MIHRTKSGVVKKSRPQSSDGRPVAMRKLPFQKPSRMDCYQDVLLSLFVYIARDAGAMSEVEKLVCRVLLDATKVIESNNRREDYGSSVLGATLHEWHRNKNYLDGHAKPRAIRLQGRSPSVAALIRSQDNSVDAASIAETMRGLGLIKKLGGNRYLPVNRVATIRKLSPAIIVHVAESLSRLLATVNFNTRIDRASPTLIERTAFVHDLPKKDIPAFREFAQQQGTNFLANIDEWLESRRASKRSLSTRTSFRAGVHIYAFEEERIVGL